MAIVDHNFFGSGFPNIHANFGILYIDIVTRIKYKQNKNPSGGEWVAVEYDVQVDTDFVKEGISHLYK